MTNGSGVALATEGLRKRYGQRVALDGLDLRVPTGVVYGFLGPNGAGKTTTMRILTGLVRADAGRVELLGRPFGRGDRHRLFEIGSLIEAPSFYPFLSGRENLRALAATGAPASGARIEELLTLVNLRDRAGDRVSGYSMGMKQRLGIAGALLSDPSLLLLDEPANGLDPAGIVGMRDTLRALAAGGKTVFVSSHILSEVQQLADEVGIIASGRLVREGSIDALLRQEGAVRIRVAADEVAIAGPLLERAAGSGTVTRDDGPQDGWLTVRTDPDRSAELNRALAQGGVFASRIEGGTTLESLFLELHRVAARRGCRRTARRAATDHLGERPGTQARDHRLVVMRLFRSNLRKLVRRPATWVTFLLLVGLLALIFVAVVASTSQTTDAEAAAAARLVVTFPQAYSSVLGIILGIGGLLAVTYGGAIAGSEWSWGTLKGAVARGESRTRYVVLAYAAVAVCALVGVVGAFVIGVALAAGGAGVLGVALGGMGDSAALGRLPEQFARAALAVGMDTALGFAIATIARSQLAGIGVGIGVYFAEGIAGLFLPGVIRWLPFSAASAVVSGGGDVSFGGGGNAAAPTLDPNTAVIVVATWLIASLVVSSVVTERAEIGG